MTRAVALPERIRVPRKLELGLAVVDDGRWIVALIVDDELAVELPRMALESLVEQLPHALADLVALVDR